jgi:ABC-type multidrug transport system fused ATPase/permease subunit
MRDGFRAALLIVRLTFRADPWRAAWLVLRSPVNMCTLLGTAVGLKLLTNAVVAQDLPGALEAAFVLVLVQLLRSLASEGSLSARATVIEKTTLLVDRMLMEAALDVPGLAHHEVRKHRDQLELLRLRRGELGELVDTISHNLGMLVLSSGSVLLLAQIHPLLLLLPLFGLQSLWASVHAEKLRVRAQERTAELLRSARHLFEVATQPSAGKEMRIFGLGPALVERHRHLWGQADRAQDRASWVGGLVSAGSWWIFSVAYIAAIGFVLWLALEGRATAGDVVLALKLAAGVNELVQYLAFMAGWLFGQIRTAGRVIWLRNYAETARFAHDRPAHAPDRLRRGIRLDGATFRYPDSDRTVLHDLTLDLPAGTTVAVVGENGAGKSTLVKLLARFYDPTSGQILVDGVDLRRIEQAEWRTRLAAGFQDFARLELLAGQTVGVGDLARIEEEEAVAAALDRAAATDVVAALPQGVRTPLGPTFDNGFELSGGQWQKLALGRAMMRQAPLLLVLDEPTASLDALTEHALFDRYAANARRFSARTGAITVLISHRFSTVRQADLIVVLDRGRLVEHGSHDQLMAAGGRYAELFSLQARGYR